MTRISRISTPRATLAALALLIVVMTGFGLFVDGAVAEGASVVHETAEQTATAPRHCRLTSHVSLVAIDDPTEDDHHVRL